MVAGEKRKGIIGPLLLVNLAMYLSILGISSWSINHYINREYHRHLGGNTSTVYLLMFSVLAGVVGICSVITGLMHMKGWGHGGLANSALSSGLVSWAITALSLGFACKQIALGGNRGRRLRTLEAFVIILTLTQLVYLLLLQTGVISKSYDPSPPSYGVTTEDRQIPPSYGVTTEDRQIPLERTLDA